MFKNKLLAYAKSIALDAVGIVSFPLPDEAISHLSHDHPCPFTYQDLQKRLSGNVSIKDPKSLIVVLFPYYVPYTGFSNLSRYTWSADYHTIIQAYLTKLALWIEKEMPMVTWEIHVDTSPFADRYLAYQAGLGFYGKNHCFIHPRYGSYVTIGTLVTNLELEADTPNSDHCCGCNACYQHCPGNALSSEKADGFHFERCKSYLTQKKGTLSIGEEQILQKTPLLFGCDVCQEVCPHNHNIPTTPIPEFRTITPILNIDSIKTCTNKEFKERYGHRAFSWRGKAILIRNHEIIEKK